MGNCLVTKLKESVNNNNLSYLGFIVVEFEHSDNYVESDHNFSVFLTEPATFKILGGKFIVNGVQKDTFDGIVGDNVLNVTNVDSQILIPKYSGSIINLNTPDNSLLHLNLKEIYKSTYTAILLRSAAEGDISYLKEHVLESLSFSSNNVYGDITGVSFSNVAIVSSVNVTGAPILLNSCNGISFINTHITLNVDTLNEHTYLSSINLNNCGGNVTGSVENLVGCNTLSLLNISGTAITGTCESIIEKQWNSLSRRSGNITFSVNGNSTLNNKIMGAYGGLFKLNFESSKVVVTNGDGTKEYAEYDGSSWVYKDVFN